MKFSALKVHQWHEEWDKVEYDPTKKRGKPEPYFYLFTIPALTLRRLCGVYARSVEERKGAKEDPNIQRPHMPKRSEDISKYVQYGYPFYELSERDKKNPEHDGLRKPGWLPTAIVVNVLTSTDERKGTKRVHESDLIQLNEDHILIPDGSNNTDWRPKELPPIEVIDGQHRLWAFDDKELLSESFEIPVVAFHGLDLSWQAYLFYSINIKPKKISPSLAYDLYPLLRTEDWLDSTKTGHKVYREARAQEIVDCLWAHLESPWYHRISMLGESINKKKIITQSAWIRSLLASLLGKADKNIFAGGGIFNALQQNNSLFANSWNLYEQVAFLILIGNSLSKKALESSPFWINTKIKSLKQAAMYIFENDTCLLSQDQGIRAFLYILNGFFSIDKNLTILENTKISFDSDDDSEFVDRLDKISNTLEIFQDKSELISLVDGLTDVLIKFDWRSSKAEKLTDEEKSLKASFRGSGGYKALRIELLKFLKDKSHDSTIVHFAQSTLKTPEE